MRPLSVIHVNDIAFVGSTLVEGLRAAGVAAELWDAWKPGASLRYPWKAASLPLRAGVLALTGARLRARAPDVVHVHYATQVPPALVAGAPFFVHCHGSDIRSVRRSSIAGRMMASFLARAAGVYVATPDLLEVARELRADAQWMPNPLDTRLFAPGGTPTRDLLVGTRLSAIKGVDVAIEIVRTVRAMRPRTSITVVSHGPELLRMADAAGPEARIIEPVAHTEMPRLFRDHRVALGQFALGIVSQYELEAMASGNPVVCRLDPTDVYSQPPPVLDAPTGAEAAAGIVELLDDDQARTDRGSCGRAWVKQNHDRDLVVARHLVEYRLAVTRRTR